MKVSIRGYGAFAILAGITLFLVVQGTAAGAPAAPALAGLTPEPESYLPLVARQPTLTPTPTPTATVTPTPTNTPTPQPTVISSAQYCHGPFIPIPDTGASTINDAILIKESGAIVDMDVYINTAHTWVGDLRFSLTHNGVGTTRTLIDRPGVPASPFGCLRDDISAILDDSAILPVENQCANAIPTISGTFFPNQTLSSFNGEDINGTWTLKVEDVISGSGGTFNGWCMFVEFETSGN